MSRDINDPQIKVTIRNTPPVEEKKEIPPLDANDLSSIMGNFFASLVTGGSYTTTYRNGDDGSDNSRNDAHSRRENQIHISANGDVTGYAPLHSYVTVSDVFGDGFYSDIPYLLQAMTIIEPENFSFTNKNANVVLDIHSRKCTASEIGKECAVCLEKIKEGDAVATINCAHTFHSNCITEWGKYKQECPLCRSRIPILEE
jgi:Ring finger domain